MACYVGHSNLRRWVMGEAASQWAASPAEVEQMAGLLAEAMAAGAAGLSSSAAPTHSDLDGRPVPSRFSDEPELLALVEVAGRFGGTIAYLPKSSIGGLDKADEDYLIRLGQASGLPVIIQGLGGRNKVDAPTATWEASKEFLERATALGAPVYSLLIARPFDRPIVINSANFHYLAVPVVGPHAEAASRRADGVPAPSGGSRRDALCRGELQPGPGQGHDGAPAPVGSGLRRPGHPA